MMRRSWAVEGQRNYGTLEWSRGGQPAGSIRYTAIMDEPGKERLELFYSRGPEGRRENVTQTVRLTFTQPQYGGKRWWMICPHQHCRVGKLYLPAGGDRFASRKAWGLGYRSQRIAPSDRPLEALFRLQAKLGCIRGIQNTPTRPKGMWQRTFDRHMARFDSLNHQTAIEMLAMLERITGRPMDDFAF
jgi:hypothetical protein